MSNIRLPSLPVSTFAAILGVFAIAAPASASLFLDPAGGAAVTFSDTNDGASSRGFWFEGPFFGQSTPSSDGQVTVSINGHLRFGPGSSEDYNPTFLGTTGVDRIAPMWMDFNLGSGGQIIESIGALDAYYVVSWLNMEKSDVPGAFANFQVILFNSATVLNGANFNAGDIVFSYGDIGIYYANTDPEITQTVAGLENSSGDFASLPGFEFVTGWHSYDAFGDFPVGEDEYVLFRPDGNGGYNVSIQASAVPEPSAFAAFAGAFALAGACLRRRRR